MRTKKLIKLFQIQSASDESCYEIIFKYNSSHSKYIKYIPFFPLEVRLASLIISREVFNDKNFQNENF